MLQIYVNLLLKDLKTIEEVPEVIREKVRELYNEQCEENDKL